MIAVNMDEYISETVDAFKQNALPLVPADIADSILDTLFAQGHLGKNPTGGEIDLAHEQVTAQVKQALA